MRRNVHPLIAAALVILCILFIWGTSPAQEQTCKVLSEQEAKDAALFEDWAVTLQCPGKILWVPRKEYRIAEACETVKLIHDADLGVHWAPEQEESCRILSTPEASAEVETIRLAEIQHCGMLRDDLDRWVKPNLNGKSLPCTGTLRTLTKWR